MGGAGSCHGRSRRAGAGAARDRRGPFVTASDRPTPDAVGSQDYREAMAHLGAAVNIVTTDGPAGRAGFTASAVCSVTDNPPTLLVCINRTSSAYASVIENGVVCVNALSAHHQALSRLFGGRIPADERFSAAAWSTLETGSP